MPQKDVTDARSPSGRVESGQIGSGTRPELQAEVLWILWLTTDRPRPVGKSGVVDVVVPIARGIHTMPPMA